jgi:hypothetical protein
MVEHAHAPKRDVHPNYTFEVESLACVATPITNKLCSTLRRTEALKKLNNNLFLIIVNTC